MSAADRMQRQLDHAKNSFHKPFDMKRNRRVLVPVYSPPGQAFEVAHMIYLSPIDEVKPTKEQYGDRKTA